MKNLIILLALTFQMTALAVSSTQRIQFLPKENIPFSEIGKSPTYKGIILLEDSTQYEIYELTTSKTLKVSETWCQQAIYQLFGNKMDYQIEIQKGHTGSVCTFEFFNPIKKQTPAYRFGIIGFIRARPLVIVTGSGQTFTIEDKSNSLKFWQTLR